MKIKLQEATECRYFNSMNLSLVTTNTARNWSLGIVPRKSREAGQQGEMWQTDSGLGFCLGTKDIPV